MTTTDHQALINKHIQLTRIMTALQERKGRIEMELQAYMESEEATVIVHPTHDVELKESRAYDHSKLVGLHELIDPTELIESRAFMPAYQTMIDVPEKWDMTKLKPFAKYGGEIKATIEDSAYVSGVKLSITAKPVEKPSGRICIRCHKDEWAIGSICNNCNEKMIKERGLDKPVKSLECPLCNRPSTSGTVHVDCVDREQAMADRE